MKEKEKLERIIPVGLAVFFVLLAGAVVWGLVAQSKKTTKTKTAKKQTQTVQAKTTKKKTQTAKKQTTELPKIPSPTVVCINKSPERCVVTLSKPYGEDLTVTFQWSCTQPRINAPKAGIAGFEKVILPAGTTRKERVLKLEDSGWNACSILATYWPQDQHYRIYPHRLYSDGIKMKNISLPALPFPSVKCNNRTCTVEIDQPYPKDLRVMYFVEIACPNKRFGRWEFASAPNYVSIPAGRTSVTKSIWSLGRSIRGCRIKPGWTDENGCRTLVCPPIKNAHVWVPEMYQHGGCNFFERALATARLQQ